MSDIADLRDQVNQLQLDSDDMKAQLIKAENKISDLQCRDNLMRDILIFTGIEEPAYNPYIQKILNNHWVNSYKGKCRFMNQSSSIEFIS